MASGESASQTWRTWNKECADAFLASAASTHDLQQSILSQSIGTLDDESQAEVKTSWISLSNSPKPDAESAHIQRAWDKLVTEHYEGMVWSHATADIDRARLLAASSPHSGDWLAAPPITSVGLRCLIRKLGLRWHTDLDVKHASLTHVDVARQWMHGPSWPGL